MRLSPDLLARFVKFVVIGALVGIVFSVIFLALPLAGLLFLVAALDLGISLPWVPTAPTILAFGAIVGALFSAFLFIKDHYVPYVEDVPDFEKDRFDDFFDDDDDDGPPPGYRLH